MHWLRPWNATENICRDEHREVGIKTTSLIMETKIDTADTHKDVHTRILWDPKATLAGLNGDKPLFIELATLFVSESIKQTTTLNAAISDRNQTEIKNTAHIIKGAVGHFHAKHASLLAAQIEKAASFGDHNQCVRINSLLQFEMEKLRIALSEVASRENIKDAEALTVNLYQ